MSSSVGLCHTGMADRSCSLTHRYRQPYVVCPTANRYRGSIGKKEAAVRSLIGAYRSWAMTPIAQTIEEPSKYRGLGRLAWEVPAA